MQILVDANFSGLTLSQFLTAVSDVPQWAIRESLHNRDIKIDGKRCSGDIKVSAGQTVTAYWPRRYLQGLHNDLPVLFQNEHLLALEKPQGLLSGSDTSSEQGDSALNRARDYLKKQGIDPQALRLCHRLDTMTGGILLFAKDEESYDQVLQSFESHLFQKEYECLVKGCPAQTQAHLHAWLRKDARAALVSVTDYPARNALPIETAYEVIDSGEISRLRVRLYTGRTHQIRAHLAHIGHPILGDDKYGDRTLNRAMGVRRQQLWHTKMTLFFTGTLAYLNGTVIESPPQF